jgi:hypothetical protein
MKKIIIAAILAAVSLNATAADTEIDAMSASRDLRASIEKMLIVSGDTNATLRSYNLSKTFENALNSQMIPVLNNNPDASCELIAARVAQNARGNYAPYQVNPLMTRAIEDMIGKMTVYTMAQCYYLKS